MADAAPKRHKMSSSDTGPVDRISNLPESLISSILSCLPTKDAVATSILSRSWRFCWTKATSFRFDRSENQIRRDDVVQRSDFVDSVNMALLNHSGEPIHEFLLRWESRKYPRSMFLSTWINVAIARHVRVLSLDVQPVKILGAYCSIKFALPSSIYTSGTLGVLKLQGPFLLKPSMVCLPKLEHLELFDVRYGPEEAIPKLMSGCSVLEYLKITRTLPIFNPWVCSISSISLKHLHMSFHNDQLGYLAESTDVTLYIDTPALEVLDIKNHMSSHIYIQQQLTKVKKVVLVGAFLDPDVVVGLMQTFSSVNGSLALHSRYRTTSLSKVSFVRLAKLVIQSPQWSTLVDLLDGCHVLEELGISSFVADGHSVRIPARVPRCFSSLRRVTVGRFDGCEKEVTMLKFFLDHCFKLERLDVCSCGGPAEFKRSILDKVSKMSRASPACKIGWPESSVAREYFKDILIRRR